jgi:VWFA-related protein
MAQTALPSARRGFIVEITEPLDDAIVMGPARIAADVKTSLLGEVLEVTFYVDDEKLFVDREAPYQTVHDFGPDPRSVVIRAVATHVAGYSVEDIVITRRLQLSYVVEVRRVVLTLTVVDGNGTPVTGLTREDFRVYEDGKEQEIMEFAVEQRPLRIALLLDTSGSMRQELPQVQLAAAGFLEVLLPPDRAMVVDFDDQVMLLQDLTGAREDLKDALMSTFARGGTAMYDAIHATLRRLAKQDERKAVVLLSDGGDTASVLDKDRVLEATRTGDVLIYAIGLGGADRSVLRSVAGESGGRAFFADKAEELAGIYQRIAEELRNQYVIAYSSSRPEYDGKWREVKVTYSGSGDHKVRTRPGYYAVRTPPRPLEAATITPPATEESRPLPPGDPAPPADPQNRDPSGSDPDPSRESPLEIAPESSRKASPAERDPGAANRPPAPDPEQAEADPAGEAGPDGAPRDDPQADPPVADPDRPR